MLEQILKDLGLSDKEVRVYLSLIRNKGEGNALITSKLSDLPRSTIYDIIRSLKEKGLVIEKSTKGKTSFNVETPNCLFDFLDKQINKIEINRNKLKLVIHELELMQNPFALAPSYKYYQGLEGLLDMFGYEIKETKNEDHDMRIVCNYDFFNLYNEYFKKQTENFSDIKIKIIVQTQNDEDMYIKTKSMEVKSTGKSFIHFGGMNIFGKFIGYWNGKENISCTLMENLDLALMQKSMFMSLWSNILVE